MAVPSFGFTMPKGVPVKKATSPHPLVSSELPVKADVKETAKSQSKVAAVIQGTREQMAKIMGRRRQDRPSTADQRVGWGPSASYGGYSKRE
jgi:hypothetical protein